MNGSRKLTIGIIVAVVLLATMFLHRVHYDKWVIITTFDRADQSSVKNGETDAGLYVRWPWPVMKVAKTYDRRVQLLEDRLEERQTRDQNGIIPSLYLTWRISEPLDFYRSVDNVDQAQKILRDHLRNAGGKLSEYTFAELTNPDPAQLRIADAENAMREQIQRELRDKGYGITIESVGIRKLVLAEPVTQKVFAQMRSNRQATAQQARSQGESIATDITAKATSARDRILAFADRRAQAIRAEGDAAAAEFYRVFQQDPDFAIFLRQVEELKVILQNRTTFLFDARHGPMSLFRGPQPADAPPAPPRVNPATIE